MERVDDGRALYAPRGGTYFAHRGFLVAMPAAGLQWVAAWGRLAEPDIEAFVAVLRAEEHATPHASLVDLRALTGVDSPGLARLAEFMTAERETQHRVTLRQAMVRPEGFAGVVVAGFWQVYTPPYPVEVFERVEPALAWLGLDAGTAAEFAQRCEALVAQERRGAVLLPELRAWLPGRLREADEEGAARHLGTSVRTLQRRLREAGTSFSAELLSARMRRAMTELAETERALKDIAIEVGIPSASQFSTVFRREVGDAPGAWRARNRK